MIRRKKATIFTDAKESTPVSDVKKIVEGILKIRPEDQKLFKDDQVWYVWYILITRLSLIKIKSYDHDQIYMHIYIFRYKRWWTAVEVTGYLSGPLWLVFLSVQYPVFLLCHLLCLSHSSLDLDNLCDPDYRGSVLKGEMLNNQSYIIYKNRGT